MLFAILALAIGVVIGAYSHKYLAKVTGAPANLTVASVTALVEKPAVKAAAPVAPPPAPKA